MKHLILYCAILISCTFVRSQSSIEGNLLSTDGKPVENMSITFHPKTNKNHIVGWAFSDAKGKFVLNTAGLTDSVWVVFRSMVYKDTSLMLAINEKNVRLILPVSPKEIKEVSVKGQAIQRNGDTVTYYPSKFATEKDKSIREVILKMPGFEENEGKIVYQGKQIEKYYIEGLDLLENNYQLANSNLPHKSVGAVEVWENHQSKKIFDGAISSDNVALNIKLKNNITVTGTGSFAAGLPAILGELNVTPMLFNKKQQIIISAQANNIGKELNEQLPSFDMQTNTMNFVTRNVSIAGLQKPEIKPARYTNNHSVLGTYNQLIRLTKGHELKVNASYNFSKTKQYGQRHTVYYLPDTTLRYIETTENLFRDNYAGIKLTYTQNIKKRYIKNQGGFSQSWDNALGKLSGSTYLTQQAKTPVQSLFNNLELIFPIGKHFLNLYSIVEYELAPHKLTFEPGIQSAILSGNTISNQIAQGYWAESFEAHHYTGYSYGKGKFRFGLRGGNKYRNKQLITNMYSDNSLLLADSLRNNLQWTELEFYTSGTASFTKGDFKLNLLLPVNQRYYAVSDQFHATRKKFEYLSFTPLLSSSFKIGTNINVSAALSYSQSVSDLSTIMQGYIINGYRTISKDTDILGTRKGITHSIKLEYKLPEHGLFFNAAWVKNYSIRNLLNRSVMVVPGVFYNLAVEDLNYGTSDNVSAEISQFFFNLNSTLKLKALYGFSETEYLFQNIKASSENRIYMLSPELMVNKFKGIAIMLSYKPKFIQQTTLQTKHEVLQQSSLLEVSYFLKKSGWLSFETEYYTINQKNQPKFQALFSHLSYGMTLKKPKLSFIIKCNNIFNAKHVVNFYQSSMVVTETYYQLRPRELTLSISFSFVDLMKNKVD